MLKSMTGYGRGEIVLYNRKVTVEIKSVNHRYHDINIRLPKTMNSFEEDIRKKITEISKRGKTDVYVFSESYSENDIEISLNKPLATAYHNVLNETLEFFNLKDNISLSLIMGFPDILTIKHNIEDENLQNELRETLNVSLDKALANFVTMKEKEGYLLGKDILKKLELIEALLEKISDKSVESNIEYKSRLENKVRDVLKEYPIDEARILTEVAIFADKTCTDEEFIRLKSHFLQFKDILENEELVGRKIDFLLQEINREINTIASKSTNTAVIKNVVEVKSELEKIREQIQNIE